MRSRKNYIVKTIGILLALTLQRASTQSTSDDDPHNEFGEQKCATYDLKYKNTSTLLRLWGADDPDIPVGWVDDQIASFDWTNEGNMELAARYKHCELPFKIYGVPELHAVTNLWTDDYLSEKFDGTSEPISNTKLYSVIHSETSHFMFYRPLKQDGIRFDMSNYTAPTDVVKDVTYRRWLELAESARSNKIGLDSDHWYLQSAAPPPWVDVLHFITEDLSMFSTRTPNFWVPVPKKNKGIQCRFGMRGIQAASHFDKGRNFVAMIRGEKRYILHPPNECNKLGIISDHRHPSFRHSEWEWGDLSIVDGSLGEAQALETVVREGEILYIPSYWFHFIVSIDISIQCNTRHGSPMNDIGMDDIRECIGVHVQSA